MIFLNINTPFDFAVWFYNQFIDPLFDLMKNANILGFSLFSWIISFSLVALGVRFVRSFFDSNRG